MPKTSEVLAMLRPQGGWVVTDDNFDTVVFDEGVTPVTQSEFEAVLAKYDDWKAEQDAEKVAAKASATAKLEALGLTADDLKALGL